MHVNVPNSLTLFRIALIPVLMLVFYLPFSWSTAASAAIFTVGALSDGLDGYLARKLQQTSRFGAFLDPVADKLLVAVALVLLVQANPTPLLAIPAAIIVGREIAVSALREWMAEVGARAHVAVTILAKIKTIAQMVALPLLLYRQPVGFIPTVDLGMILLYVAAALTLWSMMIYLHVSWPVLRGKQCKLEKAGSP